jgi:hypothetical protein
MEKMGKAILQRDRQMGHGVKKNRDEGACGKKRKMSREKQSEWLPPTLDPSSCCRPHLLSSLRNCLLHPAPLGSKRLSQGKTGRHHFKRVIKVNIICRKLQ